MRRNIIVVSAKNELGNSIIKLLSKNDNIILMTNASGVSKQIQEQFGGIICCTCDITKPNEVESMVNVIVAKYGNIDILINNFDFSQNDDIINTTYEGIAHQIDVSTKGPVYVTKAVLSKMYMQGNGLIINTGTDSNLEKYDYHILAGSGKFIIDDNETEVKAGDSIIVEPNKKFAYIGKMIITVEIS